MIRFTTTIITKSAPPKMTRTQRYAFRRDNGMCVQCGEVLIEGEELFCAPHRLKHRRAGKVTVKKWRAKNPDKAAARDAQLRADRIANPEKYRKIRAAKYLFRKLNGLCTACGVELDPATLDTVCDKHRKMRNKGSRKWRRKNPEKAAANIARLKADRERRPGAYKRKFALLYTERKKHKRCVDCGKRRAVEGHRQCKKHLKAGRERARNYQARRRKAARLERERASRV
jgi:hypothetical protein